MSRLTEKVCLNYAADDYCYTSKDGAGKDYWGCIQKLGRLEDLEEQGRLIELPCEKVYRIINYDSPKYAFIDSIPIEMMPIYDLKHIDNGNIFFSTKEKAEVKLAEMEDK